MITNGAVYCSVPSVVGDRMAIDSAADLWEHIMAASAAPGAPKASYSVTPVLSDGTKGPVLELRPLFAQFDAETAP
jgi:hypothetical protein